MLRLIRIARCLLVAFCAVPAAAAEDDDDAVPASQPGTGLECSPAVSEVESRRAIPISCTTRKKGVTRVEVRYRPAGKKKYTKIDLKKTGDQWLGEIPCRATAKRGKFKVSFTGRNSKGKIVARIRPIEIAIVSSTEEAPPALPGREPPMRCYEAAECPPEFRGSPACPGTKASAGALAWGAGCAKNTECQQGLACIDGTCETPPKCEANEDCASNECSDGVCQFPDEEELASRIGPPRHHWFGLHFAGDMAYSREAVGVCGNETEDSRNFTCYEGGNAYEGTPNVNVGDRFPAKFRLGTMRVMLSYEHWFGRVSAGARVGYAFFGGAPEGFRPFHLEGRLQFALRKDVLHKRGRPYLGIAFGMARVDVKDDVAIVDCSMATAQEACRTAPTAPDIVDTTGVRAPVLDAYRIGSKYFFGPTLGYIIAFSNDAALSFNVNVMFPDLVLEPAIGYVMGL